MVCIPCILVPLFLWLYMKFIQPLVMRLVPEKYRSALDSWLYPTCPVSAPPTQTPEDKATVPPVNDTDHVKAE